MNTWYNDATTNFNTFRDTAPIIAYRVIVWHGNIKPEDRNSRNLSDGATFRNKSDVERYVRGVTGKGGMLCGIREIENPGFWYESLEEFDRTARMSVAELESLHLRCKDLASTR